MNYKLPPNIIEFNPALRRIEGHMDKYDGVGYDQDFEEHGFYWNDRSKCFYSHCAGVIWPVTEVDPENPYDI
jgi:hypothetical protein